MKTRALFLLLSPYAAFLAASSAHAQAGAAAPAAQDQAGEGQVVTVTATKRNERITDVPIAITAIGAAEIRDRGAVDIRDFQYSVPGLSIQQLSPGSNYLQLRGVGSGPTGQPVVGTYFDEMSVSLDQAGQDTPFPLVDLARVEVLRGPQGTLYGGGSLAGTIRYITRNPSLTKTDGFAEANLYQLASGGLGHRLNAAVGVPLVEGKVGLRLTAGVEKMAGWIDTPAINVEDGNKGKRTFIRPKLLIQPNNALTITLMAQIHRQDFDSDNLASLVAVPPGNVLSTTPGVRDAPELYPAKDDSDLANLVVQYDLGSVTLTSSTGYLKRKLFSNIALPLPFAVIRGPQNNDSKQWSQELRLSSNAEGPLQYTVGVWARKYESAQARTSVPFIPAPGLNIVGTDPNNSTASAVFGDATWKLSPQWELSAGGRYYRDRRDSELTDVGLGTPPAKASGNFSSFSPRLSARYGWDRNASTYATVSKGFRSGGFSQDGSPFDPETMWNYELGHKAALMGGRLFLDAAVFYADYQDRQSQSAVAAGPAFIAVTRNTGKAAGPGVEAAVNARLGMGLELNATVGWNAVKSKVTNAEVVVGQRFDFTPALTSSLSLSQRFAVRAGLTGMWRVDYQHTDAYDLTVRQVLPDGSIGLLQDWRSASQDYLNLRAGLEGKGWSLALDVKNATNKQPLTFANVPIFFWSVGTYAPPRSIGLTYRQNF